MSTENDLLEIIETFINNNVMFTAYDVSQEYRKQLIASNSYSFKTHRHNALKDAIHTICLRICSNYNYDRQLLNVGAATDAFVYFNSSIHSLSNYTPVDSSKFLKNLIASQNVLTAAAFTTLNVAQNPKKDIIAEPDARGTVCVPNRYILKIHDSSKGKQFYVHNSNGKVFVDQNSNDSVTSYTLDSSNNIRITANTLFKCGFINKNSYAFNVNGNSIVIT